jgi:hypothetical protein
MQKNIFFVSLLIAISGALFYGCKEAVTPQFPKPAPWHPTK